MEGQAGGRGAYDRSHTCDLTYGTRGQLALPKRLSVHSKARLDMQRRLRLGRLVVAVTGGGLIGGSVVGGVEESS